MLLAPILAEQSFTIHTSKNPLIRRDSNALEDALKEACPGGYSPPQLIPMPDELSPETPRIIFNSINGYSKISISQKSLTLSVKYSADWQSDRVKCSEYLNKRSALLFRLLEELKCDALFVGIGTKLIIMSDSNDNDDVVAPIKHMFSDKLDLAEANELNFRFSLSVEDKYYNNATIGTVSYWDNDAIAEEKISTKNRIATSIEINGDYNNRLAYNETRDAIVSTEESVKMINRAVESVYRLAEIIGGSHD